MEMETHVSISRGNSKMGQIKSVSHSPYAFCRECKCWEKCYARKLYKLRKTIRKAWDNNTKILLEDREKFFREVEGAIMTSAFFRFHVSGDIPDDNYFFHMVELATRHSHCQMLAFTKKFEIVNKYIDNFGALPSNLHVIFSGWKDLEMVNPHNLPEAHVLYKDGTTTASDGAKFCGGNCTECAKEHCGCWNLQKGEQVIFKQH